MSVIRRMVLNPVAGNMLMLLILGGGLTASFLIPREMFPEFDVNYITVAVPYPGAGPADIEKGICLKVEDSLYGVDGIKEVSSTSNEGVGSILLELKTGADVRKVLDDVKSEVDKIDFKGAEDPVVAEVTVQIHVINVALGIGGNEKGRLPDISEEHTLKELAEDIRDEINDLPEISQVNILGVRDYEIVVEISEQDLRRYALTLAQVARAIRQSSFDLPVGSVKTRSGELTIRVAAQKDTAEEYKKIVLLSQPDGAVVRLGDIAEVREGFEDVDVGGLFNGRKAVMISVYKTGDEDSIKIAEAVRRYVERKKSELPDGIMLDTWSDLSKPIQDRLDMLVRNGLWGLVLVFLILWLFLSARLSVWVAMGIPVSLLGTIFVLNMFGQTLNMMSMFALIMALGLIVDDAIVVGENVYSGVERGEAPRLAAVNGTRRVLMPVVAAVMTTWIAFVPMLFIPGVMGKFIQVFPIVVILALAFSLIECVLILPPHLAHSLRARRRHHEHIGQPTRLADTIRARIDGAIRWFIDVPFMRAYRLATRYRYITLALALGVLTLTVGAQQAGFIPFITMPKDVDSDMIRARITLQTGTPFERTRQVARQVTAAVKRINEQVKGEDGKPIIRHVYSLLGQHGRHSGRGSKGAHLCQVIVELSPTEHRGRSFTSEQIIQMWRKNTGPIPDAVSHNFGSFRGGPGGAAFEIRLMGPNTDYLKPAVDRLNDRLGEFTGVSDISDDAVPGNMEMKIVRLKPGAENLGITLDMLSAQLGDAFYGNESVKIQRGRDEIKVMVRYPASQRRSLGDVENMRVRTPDGDELPFGIVADVVMERGYTTLRRVGRNSVVTVSADIDEKTANVKKIIDELSDENGFFAELEKKYPELKIEKRGQSYQMAETFDALRIWVPISLMAIYTILAAMFRSYIQPIIIMIAIPFGLVGAVVGHWLLGFDVTLLSVFGMVALAGIVVNDSLVLIDRINRGVRAGAGVFASVAEGARARFRPIILTTITTVAGITPLLFERSFQAQFLKPMAVSLAFGLMFATMLTLLVVPSLYLIGNDIRRVFRWQRTGVWPSPEDVVKRDEPMEEK